MYPPRFHYEAPRTLDEACQMMAYYREDAKVLSGGMSLVPLMKLRFASPGTIVDLNQIEGLDYIEEAADTFVLYRIDAPTAQVASRRSYGAFGGYPPAPSSAAVAARGGRGRPTGTPHRSATPAARSRAPRWPGRPPKAPAPRSDRAIHPPNATARP